LGACYLAGMGIGLWDKSTIKNKWVVDKAFHPEMTEKKRQELYYNWQRALKACVAFADKLNY
jgi:glycerol kinase